MQTLHSPLDAASWLRQHVTGQLRTDSRQVQPGDAFIAWPGAATDGRRFLAQALARGAAVCLLEQQGHEAWTPSLSAADVAQLAMMTDLKAQTGPMADAYYERPSEKLSVLAVTGTNGKTSTAWWLAQALGALSQPCGLMGTLGVGVLPDLESTGLTTPDPVLMQQQFRLWADAGVRHCAMEASSIGLAEHRLTGTRIQVAVFTNFTQDHLDYHGDMGRYWAAKEVLFDWPGLSSAVINVDDPEGAKLAARLTRQGLDVWTCSRQGPARLQALALTDPHGLAFEVREGTEVQTLRTGLIGDYNIDNLLGVIGSLRALGVDLADAVSACGQLSAVPGRMQWVSAATRQPMAVVDYAHTPDAVTHTLSALRAQAVKRGGQLWCVLGCGGDRDPIKRPLMAAAAEAAADHVVLTSDNPRSESPEAILAQMRAGLLRADRAVVHIDRAEAIAWAVTHAAAADVVLVAGKGHETYQEIQGVRMPFDDVAQVQAALQGRVNTVQGVAA